MIFGVRCCESCVLDCVRVGCIVLGVDCVLGFKIGELFVCEFFGRGVV